MNAMKGLILAAGEGRRLKPLTDFLPKALIPILERPLIDYVLLKFKEAGIKKVGVVIRKKDYPKFKARLRTSGIRIKYIFQNRRQGTAKAVACAKNFIGDERFLLGWCDFLSPFDFSKLVKAHLKYKPAATILVNKEKDISGGSQVLFKGSYITRIIEKPRRRISFWSSTGLMVLEPEIFRAISKIKPSADGEYHIPDALQYLINQGRRVRFLRIDAWRINTNTLQDLLRAVSLVSAFEGLKG